MATQQQTGQTHDMIKIVKSRLFAVLGMLRSGLDRNAPDGEKQYAYYLGQMDALKQILNNYYEMGFEEALEGI